MRPAVVAAVAVVTLSASAPASALLPEQIVRATPKAEWGPTAGRMPDGARVVAWTQRRSRTWKIDAYLKVGQAAPVRLNLRGTASADGIDVPWVAYTVIRGLQKDIRLYNIDTKARSAPPDGVNTAGFWEGSATLSGDWLLFKRWFVVHPEDDPVVTDQWIILRSRSSQDERILDQVGPEVDSYGLVEAGQVAGDFAVWHACGDGPCSVFRHTISTAETVRLPLPTETTRRQQYAPSVTPAGVVYAIRSQRHRGCGKLGIRLVRYFAPGDPSTGKVIAARRPGTTASRTFAVAGTSGAGVFLDRQSPCKAAPGKFIPSDLTRVVDPG
jgi:hypothetical protein